MQMNSIQGVKTNQMTNYQVNTGAMRQDKRIQSLQKQIELVQDRLAKLSENKDLSMEESMERRKMLQEQLDDLNKQIMQRRMDIQKEKQETSQKIAEQAEVNHDPNQDIHNETLEQLMGADLSLNRLGTLRSTQVAMQGRAKVLENEIKIDRARGASTESKEEELSKIKDQLKYKIPDLAEDLSKETQGEVQTKEGSNQSSQDITSEDEKRIYNEEGIAVKQETDEVESILI